MRSRKDICMNYYAYASLGNRYVRVHTGPCSYCQEGQGINAHARTNQSKWYGPYDTLEAVSAFVKTLKQKNTRTCKYCLDGRKL